MCFQMPFHKFIPSYHHHFGRQCRVADYGYTKLKATSVTLEFGAVHFEAVQSEFGQFPGDAFFVRKLSPNEKKIM